MDWQTFASLAAAFGAGSVIARAVEVVVQWRRGKFASAQANWREMDRVSREKQLVLECLLTTRQLWHVEAGKAFEDMPELPPLGSGLPGGGD